MGRENLLKNTAIKRLVTILLLFVVNCQLSIVNSQTTGLQGRVVDAQSGELLPFVQVGFVNSNIGTVTDGDGRFRLVSEKAYDSVRFQMMGYVPKVVAVKHGTIKRGVKIELEPRVNTLKPAEITAKRRNNRYRRRNNPAVELARNVIAHKSENDFSLHSSRLAYSRETYEKEVLALDDFQHDFDNKWPWRRLKSIERYIGRTPFDEVPALYISIRETKKIESDNVVICVPQMSKRKAESGERQCSHLRPADEQTESGERQCSHLRPADEQSESGERRAESGERKTKTLITARHLTGMNEMMGHDGMDSTFSAMFVPVNIYDNDIEIMLTHFTSPLHSVLATTFYHYYITDTLEYEGTPCVELSFAPANTSTYGFTGSMLVALDSSYAVLAYNMAVSHTVSLNYVHGLTIRQTFKHCSHHCSHLRPADDQSNHLRPADDQTPLPKYLPERTDIYGRIYVSKMLQQLYFQQTTWHDNYRVGDSAVVLPDSLFKPMTHTASLPREQLRTAQWDTLRPMPLSKGERGIDSMRNDIMQLPEIRFLKKLSLAVVTGHINTRRERDSSRFDLGPIYNFISHNHHEGWRLRIGGMTTARLSTRNFIEGYMAYGFRDKKPKFSTSLIHTFDEKQHNSHETPLSLVSLRVAYDLEAPGQSFEKLDRDNISSSNDNAYNLQYVGEAQLRLRKEFPSHFNIDTWLAARHYTPTGTLHYYRLLTDGTTDEVRHFAEAEWTARLAYFPYLVEDFGRPGNASLMRLKKDIPTVILSHRMAYLTGGFFYQRTDISADKRFWLSILGYIDVRIKSGIIWNRVPLPRLIIPDGNDGIFLEPSAFNTMHPMEFIVDRYASLHTTYHAKGLILNHIPLIRRLKLREVAGFNILCGGLSDRNNPLKTDNAGLYQFPTGTQALGNTPYMEFSIGIENIFRLIRIDYIRRLTYTDGLTSHQRGAIRLEIKIML